MRPKPLRVTNIIDKIEDYQINWQQRNTKSIPGNIQNIKVSNEKNHWDTSASSKTESNLELLGLRALSIVRHSKN
jgi:hypothetical protein